MANAAVTGGVCTCKAASMTWFPERGGCACNMAENLMLEYNAVKGTYSCGGCHWVLVANEKCSCPSRYQTPLVGRINIDTKIIEINSRCMTL